MIDRRARAPVLSSIAFSAIAPTASRVKCKSTPSIEKSLPYCFTSEFLVFCKICSKSLRVNSSRTATIGRRPINSGIIPKWTKSSGCTSQSNSLRATSLWWRLRSVSKPIALEPIRFWTIFSRSTKAPPQIKSIFEVSSWMYSWFGCFLPPCGGTLHTVPSSIFKRACCTPSPETSRVIETLSVLRPILSISSTYIIPHSAFLTSYSADWRRRSIIFSTSSPT